MLTQHHYRLGDPGYPGRADREYGPITYPTKSVIFDIVCNGGSTAPGGRCYRAQYKPSAGVAIAYGSVRYRDNTPPSIGAITGRVTSGQWQRPGQLSIGGSASAPSGIRRFEAFVNGGLGAAWDQTCDYSLSKPCWDRTLSDQTSTVSVGHDYDGRHAITLRAVHAANQQLDCAVDCADTSTTAYTDGTAPGAATGVTNTRSSWQRTNSFPFTGVAPASEADPDGAGPRGQSPIVSRTLTVCPAAGRAGRSYVCHLDGERGEHRRGARAHRDRSRRRRLEGALRAQRRRRQQWRSERVGLDAVRRNGALAGRSGEGQRDRRDVDRRPFRRRDDPRQDRRWPVDDLHVPRRRRSRSRRAGTTCSLTPSTRPATTPTRPAPTAARSCSRSPSSIRTPPTWTRSRRPAPTRNTTTTNTVTVPGDGSVVVIDRGAWNGTNAATRRRSRRGTSALMPSRPSAARRPRSRSRNLQAHRGVTKRVAGTMDRPVIRGRWSTTRAWASVAPSWTCCRSSPALLVCSTSRHHDRADGQYHHRAAPQPGRRDR